VKGRQSDPPRVGMSRAADGIRTFSMAWVIMGHLLVFPEGFAG
jgi:hypothetical protein